MRSTMYKLEELIAHPFRELNWKLSLAESCTGGLISHRVTNVAGSSDYYLGGINAYSNIVKQNILGVSPETLSTYGAVSEQTVREMASGATRLFQSEVALSVSGIAGPSGGTSQKPVGTVWIGLAILSDVTAACFRFSGDRIAVKNQSAEIALWMLYQALCAKTKPQGDVTLHYQPTVVDFSFSSSSKLRIHSFYWQNIERKVESMGRLWHDELGYHFLVMDFRQQVYELVQTQDGCWYIHPPQQHPPV